MINRMVRGIQRKTVRFAVIYTGLFICLAVILDYIFATENKTFIWGVDGVAQHAVALKYIRNYLIKFFTTGKVTMMDFNIGQGFDVIGTLNYYGFGDPVNILTVLFPESALETMYEVLIFVRMYISGIFVAYLCKLLNKRRISSVVSASLLYAFCMFVLVGGMKHPMFLNGVMYLPLLIAGVEKIIKNKKIYVLVIAVALSFVSNYYFMYMNTIIAAVYFFIRQIGDYRSNGAKLLLKRIGKVILSYVWGVAISAVVFFPALYAFMNSARINTSLAKPKLFFNNEYYSTLLKSFFISRNTVSYNWAIPGIGIIGIFAVCVLASHWKKTDKRLLLGLAALVVMLTFPIFGKIMNGFSYTAMRFSYAVALLLSVMVAYAIDEIRKVKKVPMLISAAVMISISIYSIVTAINSKTMGIRLSNNGLLLSDKAVSYSETYYVAGILGILLAIICILCVYIKKAEIGRYIPCLLMALAVVNIYCNYHSLYSSSQGNNCSDYVERGQFENEMSEGETKLINEIEEDSFYRVERDREMINKSMYFNFNQTGFYFSIVPSDITDLYVSTCISNYYKTFVMKGLEGRVGLLALAGVKYYVSSSTNAPFGFYKMKEEFIDGKNYYLYKNIYNLPLGITYSSYMTKSQYNNLNPIEREYALLSSSVVEENVTGMTNKDKVTGVKVSKVKVADKVNVKVNRKRIVSKKDSVVKYRFDGQPDSQNYIVYENIHAKDSDKDGNSAKFRGKYGFGRIRVIGDLSGAYFEKEASVLNLGYSKKAQKKFKLKFSKHRRYTYDNVYQVSVPISLYVENVRKLREEALEDVNIEDDTITGNINVKGTKVLQLSIPYSQGYSIYVDGKKTETFKSGVAYLGVKITKGKHSIKVVYRTPYLKLGTVVTIISIILLIAYMTVINKLKGRLIRRNIWEIRLLN